MVAGRNERDDFSLWFNQTAGALTLRLRRRTSERLRRLAEIEDLLQEVRLQAWRLRDQFDGSETRQFYLWLCAVADHVVMDAVRHESRVKRRAPTVVQSLSREVIREHADRSLSPVEEIFMKREDEECVREALSRLDESRREILELIYYHNLSVAEVARMTETTPDNIRKKLYRSLERLRNEIRKERAEDFL